MPWHIFSFIITFQHKYQYVDNERLLKSVLKPCDESSLSAISGNVDILRSSRPPKWYSYYAQYLSRSSKRRWTHSTNVYITLLAERIFFFCVKGKQNNQSRLMLTDPKWLCIFLRPIVIMTGFHSALSQARYLPTMCWVTRAIIYWCTHPVLFKLNLWIHCEEKNILK